MEDQHIPGEETGGDDDQSTPASRGIGEKISAAGWGLFFIWIGISFLLKLAPGVGLLGIGIITLGGQTARKLFQLKPESFWVFIGLLFTLGGIWELFKPKFDLVPILLIAAGAILFISLFAKKHHTGKD
jgi:hypothetical protein